MAGPAPTDRGKRAIVIGGSMSGLFAGLQLRARGFAVDIYERVESELSGRGAGIVAQHTQIFGACISVCALRFQVIKQCRSAALIAKLRFVKQFQRSGQYVLFVTLNERFCDFHAGISDCDIA